MLWGILSVFNISRSLFRSFSDFLALPFFFFCPLSLFLCFCIIVLFFFSLLSFRLLLFSMGVTRSDMILTIIVVTGITAITTTIVFLLMKYPIHDHQVITIVRYQLPSTFFFIVIKLFSIITTTAIDTRGANIPNHHKCISIRYSPLS